MEQQGKKSGKIRLLHEWKWMVFLSKGFTSWCGWIVSFPIYDVQPPVKCFYGGKICQLLCSRMIPKELNNMLFCEFILMIGFITWDGWGICKIWKFCDLIIVMNDEEGLYYVLLHLYFLPPPFYFAHICILFFECQVLLRLEFDSVSKGEFFDVRKVRHKQEFRIKWNQSEYDFTYIFCTHVRMYETGMDDRSLLKWKLNLDRVGKSNFILERFWCHFECFLRYLELLWY